MSAYYCRACLFLALFASVPLLSGGEPAEQPDDASVLVSQLGAEKWEARETAEKRLIELAMASGEQGERALLTLLENSVRNEDPEIRFRTKKILRVAVLKKHFREKKGFLGVSLGHRLVPIPAKDKPMSGIAIRSVIADSAAEAADFRNGDIIAQVDEHLCGEKFGTPELITYISGKDPGSPLKLVLWAGNEMIEKEVILKQRPELPSDPPLEKRKRECFSAWLRENMQKLEQRRQP